MAAERLGKQGYKVTIYDHKPNPARKFLMAGRGGLNITHSEPLDVFLDRYGESRPRLEPSIRGFTPDDMRAWCAGLGEDTFIGTSGRVFPKSFKASPLLRSWIARLDTYGVTFKPHHHWAGWDINNNLLFKAFPSEGGRLDGGETIIKQADATILALGGASWPKLGSSGDWTNLLEQRGITISPFRPANCGFKVEWSDILKSKSAGEPLKAVTLTHNGIARQGDIMIAENGLEGGLIYAFSKDLRTAIEKNGIARFTIDLKPDFEESEITRRLSKPRGRDTLSNILRKQIGLPPASISLLMEDRTLTAKSAAELASRIKALPLSSTAPFSLERAISSAGGIVWDELDDNFALKKIPNTYAIGEMIDWEAPTGGYLLQATIAMGFDLGNRLFR